jgi:hypothetical protein
MKTHTELLTLMTMLAQNALACTDHAERMKLAQELGALKYQIEQLECAKFAPLEAAFITQSTPDADGWIENTGVMPECDISAIRLHDGEVINVANDKAWSWGMKSPNPEVFDITHYKPA